MSSWCVFQQSCGDWHISQRGFNVESQNMKDFELHLQNRGLCPRYRYWSTGPLPESPKEECVIFPLIAPGGRFIGHQRYFWRCPKLRSNDEQGRYITTFLPEYKLTAFYGWQHCYGYGPLFVTEGIWDTIRVTNCYVDCIALLCNSPSKQLKQHVRMIAGGRPIISLIDRDKNKAGEKLGRAFDWWFEPEVGYEDFNAMPHDVCFDKITEILNKVKELTYA